MIDITKIEHVHFIGIGGTGMNGLAQLAILNNLHVSGSDRKYNQYLSPFKELKKIGIKIYVDDGSYKFKKNTLIVYSTAIEKNNKDLLKANKNNLLQLHRVDFLKKIIPTDAEIIAVTGTAGKTTTTGLLGWIFDYHNLNPSIYCGAGILNWKNDKNIGNVKLGNKKIWIIESDESDKSLLKFEPTHSIITNIGNDHLPKKELVNVFDKFKNQTKKISHDKINNEVNSLEFESNLIGKHNDENIKTAFSFCRKYGLEESRTIEAIKLFKGVERRLEKISQKKSIYIFDDYAHNPMKINSSLHSLINISYINKVHAFWRPHGHTSFNQGYNELNLVISKFLEKNKGSFTLMPIFFDGGTIKLNKTSKDLYNKLCMKFKNIYYVENYTSLKKLFFKIVNKNDAFLGMGARDPQISIFIKSLGEYEN